MNKRILTGLALAALVSAPMLRAEDAAPLTDNRPAADADGGQEHGGMDMGQRLDKMKAKLGLSDEQVDKLKAIGKDEWGKAKAHRDKMKALIGTLASQVKAKAADAELNATLDSLKAEMRAQQAERDAAMDARQAVLTAQQAAQWALDMAGRMRQGMKDGAKRWKERHKDGQAKDGGAAAQSESGTGY